MRTGNAIVEIQDVNSELSLLFTEADIANCVYSYGLLSVVPLFDIEFVDRFFTGFFLEHKRTWLLTLGTQKAFIRQKIRNYGNIRITTTAAEMHTTPNICSAGLGLSALYPLYTDNTPAAHAIAEGQTLAPIFAKYGVTTDDVEMLSFTKSGYLYKGYETTLAFLTGLAQYVTDGKNMGVKLYYDYAGKGKVVAWGNKKTIRTVEVDSPGTILTPISSHGLFGSVYTHSLSKTLLENGLVHTWSDIDMETGDAEVNHSAPWTNGTIFADALSPEVTQNLKKYRATDFSTILACFDKYQKANELYFTYLKNNAVEITVDVMLFNEAEPGDIVRLYRPFHGIGGVFVVLQKSFVLQKKTGIFTKLWVSCVREAA